MQNMHWKIIIILTALGICAWSVWKYDISLGKDLAGGLSMTYEVHLEDGDDADEIVPQVIMVMKNRLNPQGTLDISIIRQGRNRLEVVMPLPDETVKAAKQRVEDIIEEVLGAAQFETDELHAALRNGTAAERWGGTSDALANRIVQLQAAYDRMNAAREAYAALLNAAEPPTADQRDAAEAELAVAEIEYDNLFQTVRDQSMDEADLRRMLELSDDPQPLRDRETNLKVRDEETGELIMMESAREVRLTTLKETYPHVADRLEELIEAWEAYDGMRRGYDDAEDLKRLMRGAGVLEFRIAIEHAENDPTIQRQRADLEENGPGGVVEGAAWYEINDLKQWYDTLAELDELEFNPEAYFAKRELVAAQYEDKYYLLLSDTEQQKLTRQSGAWQLKSAGRTQDQLGRPAVSFTLDAPGGQKMGALTGNNLQKPMAIVLDGQVYSAPNIQSRIGTSGQITGTFSDQEISYLIRVLASGSLDARLSDEPISQTILGPSIGHDNLVAGLNACLVGIIAVAAFMLFYYFFAGGVADFALLCNGIIIFGIMAMQQASFTLPGIAGIVLTIGMAVDANVLIYERIREEMFAGEEDLKTAIRLGYGKALSTIIDANVTNLIVCAMLYYTATAEVKGFALTLSIGILATLFTALFVTRVIFALYTDVFKMKKLPMLPTVIPSVHRMLEPNINWIGMRNVFRPISVLVVVLGLVLVFSRGVDMYDTEFRGGVSATVLTKADPDDPDGGRILLERVDVENRVRSIADDANPDAAEEDPLSRFADATVYTAGSNQEGTQSDSFLIKVAMDSEDPNVMTGLVAAIVEEFRDVLDVAPKSEFKGSELDATPPGATFPILPRTRFLSEVFEKDRPTLANQVPTRNIESFEGGVAVLLEDFSLPVHIDEIERRMARMRLQHDFALASLRKPIVVGIEPWEDGSNAFKSVAVVVSDDRFAYNPRDEAPWQQQLADVEWNLIREALTQEATLEQVSTYSASVAETLAANAIVAIGLSLVGILVYIWIRFGSFRYSLAAIVALVHDVSVGLGFLALSHYIAAAWPGNPLGIEAFKIDLGVVAALLTIIGYSLNDTIVIMDRIRENRGKLPIATMKTVNRSINQTISRTVLTSVTTILAVAIMYSFGGTGIRPFAYTLLVGLFVGTYSSVAIAAPLVFRKDDDDKAAAASARYERPDSDRDDERELDPVPA